MQRFLSRLIVVTLSLGILCAAQAAKPTATDQTALRHAADLAEAGNCQDALPVLKRSFHQIADKDLERRVGLDGVKCAMTLNQFDLAQSVLLTLSREFPHDPTVLYVSIHAYSDIATHKAQELAQSAPDSSEAHELNAEAFEEQGKWNEAEKEYRSIIEKDPKMPGVHFKLGRLLLSRPNPLPDVADQAKKEFEKELEIDPNNAGAEYVLGEIAWQTQLWDEAATHFSRATKLDAHFGDAFVGLGKSLVSAKKYSEAVSPLQMAVKLEPMNPGAHYDLAMAYSRTGHKEEADREFAIHRQMTQGNVPDLTKPDAPPSQN